MEARNLKDTMSDGNTVVVRQRWNGADTAQVPAEALWDLHVRDQPGGVCGALPRGFLHGRLWCDKVAPGFLGHSCRQESRPHEILVCILPSDNPAALLERLRDRARS
jgi:hypothetical protein